MPLRNTSTRYGWVSIALHWGMALAIFAMFGLGLWMRDLGYYDTWYQRAPHIHKSIGLILLALLVFRLLWRATNPTPQGPPNSPRWERLSAHLTHYGLYAMLVVMMLSGYLISTPTGVPSRFLIGLVCQLPYRTRPTKKTLPARFTRFLPGPLYCWLVCTHWLPKHHLTTATTP